MVCQGDFLQSNVFVRELQRDYLKTERGNSRN
jgi:hypothetical protein